MRRLLRISLRIAGLLLLLVALFLATFFLKPEVGYPIGPETTYIVEPLDQEGYPDYHAALNQHLRQGVTPEKNAVVYLVKALGPQKLPRIPPSFYRWLEIPTPPEQGDYFCDLQPYLQARNQLPEPEQPEAEDPDPTSPPGMFGKAFDHLFKRVQRQPWQAREFPNVAAWLTSGEKALALTTDAASQPHYFHPLTYTQSTEEIGSLLAAQLPVVQHSRDLAIALIIRAMLHVGENRPEAAWADLLTCHRLARQVARGGTLIESLVGVAIESLAAQGDHVLLSQESLSVASLRSYFQAYQSLPAFPLLADKLERGERFMMLESVQNLRRHGLRALKFYSSGKPQEEPIELSDKLTRRAFRSMNWRPTLLQINQHYDAMVAISKLADPEERQTQFRQLDEELKRLRENQLGPREFFAELVRFKSPPNALGDQMGTMLLTMLTPAVSKLQAACDRGQQMQHNLQIAFALAIYRAEQQAYPKSLDELSPRYLKQVPNDLFMSKPLIYRLEGKGYLLYSLGINGRDEDGRGVEDIPSGDDVSARIPVPPRQAP